MSKAQLQYEFPALQQGEFAKIARLAYEHFGLDLTADKQALVAARLSKTVRQLGLDSFTDYYNHVVNDSSGHALICMVDQLTTNHTGFFRESAHFDFLRNTILPQLHGRDVNIWSAACSTGEEPYSIAISIAENQASQHVHVLASDISMRVLAKAHRAVFSEDRLQDIPLEILRRYFLRGTRAGTASYRIKDDIRAMVAFERINLMKSFASLPEFSVIFCRNVMIYFDKATQQNLITALLQHLEPGGYLLIGHAESLNGIEHPLEYVAPATWRKSPNAPRERRRPQP